jgi:hypothetical protein
MTAPHKAMREAMPAVTAFVDALREAFDHDQVNGWVRAGMDGTNGAGFHARENGIEVGIPVEGGLNGKG